MRAIPLEKVAGPLFRKPQAPGFRRALLFYFWATLESISALSTQKKVNSHVAMSLPPSPVMSTAVSTVDLPRWRTVAEARTVPSDWLRRKCSALVWVT